MSISRRRLLKNSALSAVSAPLFLAWQGTAAAAQTGHQPPASIDFSMGFPGDAVLLNRNENPLGPSPAAVAAANEGVSHAYRYADPILLRRLLSEHHELDQEFILVGTGSGELLNLQAIAFARDGNVISTRQSYTSPALYAGKLGAQIKWVDLQFENRHRYDFDALIAAVDKDTRVFCLVSPNNPTGERVGYEQLRRIADALPPRVLFLIDEAYIQFEANGRTGIDLLYEGYRNVLVTRTFSKAYALAGLRIGYGLGHPDIMKEIAKYGCGPTSTNMAGFGAAVAALDDSGHLDRSRNFLKKSREFYQQQCRSLGIDLVAGSAPFALLDLGSRAKSVHQQLRERHIFVRHGSDWGLPNHLRVSYGRAPENQAFFNALRQLV